MGHVTRVLGPAFRTLYRVLTIISKLALLGPVYWSPRVGTHADGGHAGRQAVLVLVGQRLAEHVAARADQPGQRRHVPAGGQHVRQVVAVVVGEVADQRRLHVGERGALEETGQGGQRAGDTATGQQNTQHGPKTYFRPYTTTSSGLSTVTGGTFDRYFYNVPVDLGNTSIPCPCSH